MRANLTDHICKLDDWSRHPQLGREARGAMIRAGFFHLRAFAVRRIRPIPWMILALVFITHCILDYDDVGRDLWSLVVLFLALAGVILVWQLSQANPPPDR